jgi:hypothetical protein
VQNNAYSLHGNAKPEKEQSPWRFATGPVEKRSV